MSILKLPTELLDEIFSYLDWDRSESLYPKKPDIINGSLTCRDLRAALIPTIFRDVVLRLRWARGQLVEPRLYKLRTEHPDLAKHIRCVYIRTEFEQCQHCAEKGGPKPFIFPEHLDDWLNPSGQRTSSVGQDALRRNADALALKILGPEQDQSAQYTSAEELVLRGKQCTECSSELDALSIVMLSIPACTTSIVFKSLPQSQRMASRDQLALHLLSTALQLLEDRLQDLTIVSTTGSGNLGFSRNQNNNLAQTTEEFDGITSDVIQKLEMNRLCFALSDEAEADAHIAPAHFSFTGFERWHQAASTVRELDICYIRANPQELLRFIKGFHNLQQVRFRECHLRVPYMRGVAAQATEDAHQTVWLVFAIELRQALRNVEIELRDVRSQNFQNRLSPSATAFILTQAVRPGVLIDADRQERLMQDFKSFLPLWEAEESERGRLATQDWIEKRGPLSDQAMSRRWR